MTIAPTISHAVQQTQEWLKELRENAGLADEAEALSVLRVVLHQLRDRLPVEESVQFAAQLPIIFRGIWFEGWVPGHVPHKDVKTRQQFFDQFTIASLPRTLPPEPMVEKVFALLARHLDPGEVSDVIAVLPEELKSLWPENARTFKARKH